MYKKDAMSALGYAIVLVILLGVVMIISTPMLINKYDNNNLKSNIESQIYQNNGNSELEELENRLNSRISRLEKVQKDKYVCTIEGNLDTEGNIVPVGAINASEKFVFVCEYR